MEKKRGRESILEGIKPSSVEGEKTQYQSPSKRYPQSQLHWSLLNTFLISIYDLTMQFRLTSTFVVLSLLFSPITYAAPAPAPVEVEVARRQDLSSILGELTGVLGSLGDLSNLGDLSVLSQNLEAALAV